MQADPEHPHRGRMVPLDYASPTSDMAGRGIASAAASITVAIGSFWIFIFLAAYLQDYLITGDGRSWVRAYRYASIPAALGLALATLLGIIAVRRRAYVLGGVALGSIGAAALLIGSACIYG